ncbi:hypothetical protein F4779DRAFT_629378 [Xylariaceae sp. FL0662B]|nr:hypothetical protein F4779DRAFT_629378 [Xylariaceae sp. FL0662B]
MPPRRSHKKSRAGCRRCKARKIKCDEVHPRCGNCAKHGVPCDFEHPILVNTLSPTETPRPTTASVSSCGSPSTSTLPPTPSPATSLPSPLCRNPDPLPLNTTPKTDRMMELKLLHHYTTITCETLAISSPVSEKIWRETVPNLAFSGGANFLADALLAVSALHLRSLHPHDQDLIRASHSYMASTLSEYSAALSKGINESNAEVLFLTSALIAFQSTASRIFTRDDSGDLRERSDAYALPMSWFHSFQGVKAVVASSWLWLRNSCIVPIIEAQPALNLDLSGQKATFFGHLLTGVEDEILRSNDDDPASQLLTRQAYTHAVAVLDWAHKIPHTGAPLIFLSTVSRRFVELLEARRPRALTILANYFSILRCLDSVWWLKGVARREVMGIVSLFDPDDAEWWSRLQWAIQIALYDGEVIPADVWGTDWTAETTLPDQGSPSGFRNHIELLSQMFSSIQNMPGMSGTLDPVAHQNALARSNSIQRHMLAQDSLPVHDVD